MRWLLVILAVLAGSVFTAHRARMGLLSWQLHRRHAHLKPRERQRKVTNELIQARHLALPRPLRWLHARLARKAPPSRRL